MNYGVKIFYKKLKEEAKVPTYATDGSVGCDLYSIEEFTLEPGERHLTFLGFSIEFEGMMEVQIRPRSGLAVKHGVTVLNTPGTIDQDFYHEIGVCLINLGDKDFTVNKGDRIAQMVISPMYKGYFIEKDELRKTDRSGGFGSTGK